MATFKLYLADKKSDNTYPVNIRLTHERKHRYINTGHFVARHQVSVSKKGKTEKVTLKDPQVIDTVNDTIKGYRAKLLTILDLQSRSVEFIKDYLLKEDANKEVDFIAFGRKFITTQLLSTGKNTETALNVFIDFTGKQSLDIKEVTLLLLNKFETYLRTERHVRRIVKGKNIDLTLKPMSDTGIKDYMGKIRQIFIAAQNEYNDEDIGHLVIKHYPFRKYKMPKPAIAQKRNVKIDTIKKIRDTPDISRRADLGRDVFMLSFYLVGMNTVDLFNAIDYKKGRISYNRAKTASRKANNAFISIKAEDEAIELIEKYRDKSGKRVFNFYREYANADSFSKAVNLGLKTVCDYEKNKFEEDITTYYARHSWATIARNVCKVSKDDVHFALNHADPEMKITDLYIEDDFTVIDEANRKVLDLLI